MMSLRSSLACVPVAAAALLVSPAEAQTNVALLQSAVGLQVDEAVSGLNSTAGGPNLQSFQVRQFDILPNLDERSGRLGFDTGSLPLADFTVTGVTLDFTVGSFTSPGSGVDLAGFAFDDSPGAVNAFDLDTVALISDPIGRLGRFSLDLGAAAAALIETGESFGVEFRGQDDTNVSILGPGALPFGDRPVLAVSLTPIPEPATGAVLAAAAVGLLCRRAQRA